MAVENLAARLKAFREARGLTKYRLAKLSTEYAEKHGGRGISQTYIYRLEKGEIKNPRRDTLQALAIPLNITVAELIGETAPVETWRLVEQNLKAYIPVYPGIYEVGMAPIDYVVCTRATMPPETLRGYRIEGLCLEPEILPGDTLIVDTALTPKIDDFVIIIVGGQPALKRHKDGEEANIHGVITEFVRKLR